LDESTELLSFMNGSGMRGGGVHRLIYKSFVFSIINLIIFLI